MEIDLTEHMQKLLATHIYATLKDCFRNILDVVRTIREYNIIVFT